MGTMPITGAGTDLEADDSSAFDSGGLSVAPRHLTPAELAARWRVSPRTLERWRVNGTGPCWLKLCGRVVYREEDVDTFESEALHGPRGK
ncbi:helix-turn-helix transcriptional regulator [Seohaeicola nanhaiensis]|uniref:Helix-turn-helix transcriptional regulator n=1 Tax=Seohaeicola nanhaiensis TaxID=1387282 RepID=A0ABV9KHK3_9RHOB